MSYTNWAKTGCVSLTLATLTMQPYAMMAEQPKPAPHEKPLVEIAPKSSDLVAGYTRRIEKTPSLSHAQKLALLQKKIKYVFVLFQENRSFDFYFGTYPGAEGLFSHPASETPGFNQPIVHADSSVGKISPFRVPQSVTDANGKTVILYAEDIDSVNHGHVGIDDKLHLDANQTAHNDRYAFTEEALKGTLSPDGTTYSGPAPTQKQVQKGELVMSHADCDTAPFLWTYADRFTLFDHFFDTVIGPSTPNAIAMISGQSGLTQWVEHPEMGSDVNSTSAAVPMVADPDPFWGSSLDTLTPETDKQPMTDGRRTKNPAPNLTFASLPLSFMGNQIQQITSQDRNPAFDLLDVQGDMKKIAGDGNKPVNWGWFQEGYDTSPPTRLARHLTTPTFRITTARNTSATRPTIPAKPIRT